VAQAIATQQHRRNDLAMLREMGPCFDGGELDNFIAAAQRRLEALEERGIQIMRNHVRAAGTAELAQ
jgi:hypothetical protein